ncbi:MarR family transcriptional regulator [Microbacterium suwonense]|uniref:MarR family transcriptional regulator n=1 Tax=Microbacterium suwonense TaxID=683047 RepID=A0ABM8FSB2_9MICO|nr:MarR family transcriptional regulator [Microbacterium suwonense]
MSRGDGQAPAGERGATVDDVMNALVQVTFQVTGLLTRIGNENDLSLTQLRVFGILRDRRPRLTELAAHLGLDKSTISGLVDRAEKRGLLARGRNRDDARAVDVYLTEDGHTLTARLYAELAGILAPALGSLPLAQREALIDALDPLLTIDSTKGARGTSRIDQ